MCGFVNPLFTLTIYGTVPDANSVNEINANSSNILELFYMIKLSLI